MEISFNRPVDGENRVFLRNFDKFLREIVLLSGIWTIIIAPYGIRLSDILYLVSDSILKNVTQTNLE